MCLHNVPVKDLLLLLRPNALILEEEVQEGALGVQVSNLSCGSVQTTHLWFLQTCVYTRLQISQVTKYTFLEFLHVAHWPAESLKIRPSASR